jgi:hypothetical protein
MGRRSRTVAPPGRARTGTQEAFGRAREPKQLVILPGGHFDAYVTGFESASTPALKWFTQYLMK